MMKHLGKIQQLISLAICLIFILAVSIRRDGKILGHDIEQISNGNADGGDTLRILDDGTVVVNTTTLAKDITGYAGTVPLEITVKEGIITEVKALENTETPEFFEEARVLLTSWNGKSIADAQALKVDAVSGATMSSNGMNIVALIVPAIMLITAFLYPLFGKKSYYCTHVCPFGSLQELAGKCVGYKLSMKPQTLKHLNIFRQVLWAVLMLCLWTGVWFDWIDYEPFSAFILQSASWVVIAIAVLFTVLSTVIMRPYCRFVCPTGTLLKYSQASLQS